MSSCSAAARAFRNRFKSSKCANCHPLHPLWASCRFLPGPLIFKSFAANLNPSLVSTRDFMRSVPVWDSVLDTRMQSPGCSPRPTLPRIWWSCDSPNCSAVMMIMTVALGISTPTSITGVAINTSMLPALNLSITSCFSGRVIRPCSNAVLMPASLPLVKELYSATAEAPGTFSDGSIRGHTMNACLPSAICWRSSANASSCSKGVLAHRVSVFLRFRGSVFNVDISISPYMVIWSVRGIGVADIANRCGLGLRLVSIALCSVPNLCCSSTITSANCEKSTCSCKSACVPTTRSISPDLHK